MINYICAALSKSHNSKKCPLCGHINPVGYRFCENCGTPFDTLQDAFESSEQTEILEDKTETVLINEEKDGGEESILPEELGAAVMSDPEPVNEPEKKKSKKKLIAGIIAAVLVVAAAVTALLIYFDRQNSAQYNDKVVEADRYMEDADYEKAETAYLEAIEIEPKEPDAYVKVADIYMEQERYEEAEEILEKGSSQAGGSAIEAKLESVRTYGTYDDYLVNTLIPDSGLADVDEELSYDTISQGVVSAFTEDFNGDDIPEMLAVTYESSDIATYLIMSLYTCTDGEVEPVDAMVCEYEESGFSARKFDVFLKEHDDRKFIVIGSEGLYADAYSLGTEIYEINDEIEEATEIVYLHEIGYVNYIIDGESVSEYTASTDAGEIPYEVDEEGIAAFEEILSAYGFDGSRINEADRYNVSFRPLECDEDEDTEKHICYVQHGIYYDDGFIELIDMGNTRYISDYTGIRERLGMETEE